jgi:starch phosphorylase
MKVLVNGGLNLSELDGWWAEAYTPEVGWALGDGREHAEPEYDAVEATRLYELLEQQVVPEFYDRDHAGIPHAWLMRIRASMSRLTPQFSSNRMVREYVDRIYSAASASVSRRLENGGKLAAELEAWHARIGQGWREIRFGDLRVTSQGNRWHFEVPVYFGDLEPDQVRVELYADPLNDGDRPTRIAMQQVRTIPGAVHGYLFRAEGPSTRPANHFTPRIVPFHPEAIVPLEESLVLWKQ